MSIYLLFISWYSLMFMFLFLKLFFILPLSNSIVNSLIPRVFTLFSTASTSSKFAKDNSLEINTSESVTKSIKDVNPVFTDSAAENSI